MKHWDHNLLQCTCSYVFLTLHFSCRSLPRPEHLPGSLLDSLVRFAEVRDSGALMASGRLTRWGSVKHAWEFDFTRQEWMMYQIVWGSDLLVPFSRGLLPLWLWILYYSDYYVIEELSTRGIPSLSCVQESDWDIAPSPKRMMRTAPLPVELDENRPDYNPEDLTKVAQSTSEKIYDREEVGDWAWAWHYQTGLWRTMSFFLWLLSDVTLARVAVFPENYRSSMLDCLPSSKQIFY